MMLAHGFSRSTRFTLSLGPRVFRVSCLSVRQCQDYESWRRGIMVFLTTSMRVFKRIVLNFFGFSIKYAKR